MDALNQEKEMLTCPVCGKQFYKNVDGSEIGFCPFCGTKMPFDVGTRFEEIDESKGNDKSNEIEESKEHIELMEAGESKDNIELKEVGESDENTEIKETGESQKYNEIKDTDELKDNNESIVSGELKENAELQEAGELKVNCEQTAINESQESANINETGSLNEIDAVKSDQFEIKDDNAIQPVIPPVVQPVLGYSPEQDKAANENLNPCSENTAPKIEEVKQDAEKTETEPKKEGKPYDVIFGIVLCAIGIILIFVYLILTPSGSINEHNTETTSVQTEQMAEQNPGR
jgi:endogenous inhibitor of DNA gyrase (YacG/DUF329 family)